MAEWQLSRAYFGKNLKGNVYYIDTGSVYPEGSLTIVKL